MKSSQLFYCVFFLLYVSNLLAQETHPIQISSYVDTSDIQSDGLRWPTYIGFFDSLEIISDLKNDRFVYRQQGSSDDFIKSQVKVDGQHSLTWVDGKYYAVNTDEHNVIEFSDITETGNNVTNYKGIDLERPHDIAYNPTDGYIYTIDDKEGLTRFDPNNGNIAEKSEINNCDVPVLGYARSLSIVNGKVYIVNSSRGEVIQMDDFNNWTVYESPGQKRNNKGEKINSSAGAWDKTGLVLNDVERYGDYWYGSNYFTEPYAGGNDANKYRLIRWRTWEDFQNGNWEELSHFLPAGIVPYYFTVHNGALYLATFHHEHPGTNDKIYILNVENTNTTKLGIDGGGYILPPSHLLDGIQPEANWIWDSGEIKPKNYYLHVRKSFLMNKSVKEATAFISAYSFAELYINGQYIDRVPTNPDPEYQTYEEIDLTPYLKKGTNTIAALVYNAGEGLHHRMDARGGFFFQAAITDKKGEITKVNSDKSWRVAQAIAWDTNTIYRQRDHTIGFRERYDAQLEYKDWEQISFDDSKWEQAKEIGVPPMEPWNHIVVVKRERLLYEIIEPVRSWNVKGYKVYDFGREITAYPRFTATTNKAGVEIILGTAERLDLDSFSMMKDNVDYTDTYITKEGVQSWQPLTWRGYRYFAIKESPDISIDDVFAEFRSFPVIRGGSFSCSDEELNQIWEIGRWTMQICAHDTWMDTPWREQTQYISGDTRYNIRYSAYAFDPNIKLLHDYNILSGAFSQRHSDEGAIRSRYPTGYHLGPTTSTYIPDYQLEWILMLHEYYMYYQNAELVKQVYPNLKKLLQYFEGYLSEERGLIGKVPGWVVLDHPDTYKQDVDGENTAMNCLYYGALNSAAWIARNIMDDSQKATEWEQKAQNVKTSIQKYLWSEKDKAFKDGFESSRITQQTQVYALTYGLVPEEKKPEVVEFVTSQGRSCEQSFSYWLLNTMFSEGEGQWALDYMRTHWGAQMKHDDFSGSWWEKWDAQPGMSKSHSWCSGPTALLAEKVLGVESIDSGWKQFKVQPNLYDLEWAEGIVPSVAGNISVKLKKLSNAKVETGMQIEAVIPENTTSLIYVPVQPSNDFAISVNDKLIWESGKFIGANNNISYDSKSDDFIVFEFQAGSYVIKSNTDL